MPEQPDKSAPREFCTFELNQLLFGVDVRGVQEVVGRLDITPVPIAPRAVTGLINLRGQIVAAIDLRERLRLPPRPDGAPARSNLIVRTREGLTCLLVDAVGDVVTVEADAFEPPPEKLTAQTRRFVLGVYKLPKRHLLHLDIEHATTLTKDVESPAEQSANPARKTVSPPENTTH